MHPFIQHTCYLGRKAFIDHVMWHSNSSMRLIKVTYCLFNGRGNITIIKTDPIAPHHPMCVNLEIIICLSFQSLGKRRGNSWQPWESITKRRLITIKKRLSVYSGRLTVIRAKSGSWNMMTKGPDPCYPYSWHSYLAHSCCQINDYHMLTDMLAGAV